MLLSVIGPYVPEDPAQRQSWGEALWIAYHTPQLQERFLADHMPCARILSLGQCVSLPYRSDGELVTAFTAWFTTVVWPTWEAIDLAEDPRQPPDVTP